MRVCRVPLLVLCVVVFALPAAAQDTPSSPPQPKAQQSVALNLLHVSFVSLEAVDVYTTVRGISGGAVEANPLMRAPASHPVGMTALKAGVAVSSVVLTRRMARDHRVAAILLTAGLNSAYAAIAVHNVNVNRR
jgi:Domain of unknown function (DUF5658)